MHPIVGKPHGMRNELCHSKEVAPGALCCIHGFDMGLLAGRQKNLGREESRLCGKETDDPRPAEPLRGIGRCIEKAA